MTQKPILPFAKILGLSYLLTALLLLAVSFLLYQFHLSDSQLTIAANIIYALSCFFGGFLSGKLMKRRKFIWGLLFGVIYLLILVLLSFLIHKSILNGFPHLLIVLGICCAGGFLGSVVS